MNDEDELTMLKIPVYHICSACMGNPWPPHTHDGIIMYVRNNIKECSFCQGRFKKVKK